jgi:two-component system, chemotaxis family, sensor kinase CheA
MSDFMADLPTEPGVSLAVAGNRLPVTSDAGAEPGLRSGPVALQSIRVNVDLLESLMATVSELVLSRNQLLQISRTQKDSEFAAPLQRLSQMVSELQEGVMKTRMQPIGNAWATLPRIVRDLAVAGSKKIELVMVGAETELDRQVLELIKDPLTHMVRNSADHGLEAPEERLCAGKPETGVIRLNAFHQGGHVIVEIGDDGRGLALDRIKAKAIAKGVATEAEIAHLSDAQIHQFIFRPGFSTAEAVTSVSGRGVGMDVVKTNIEKIGGTIELSTRAGLGSRFTIKIPLTLAIVSALIVEVAGQRFAVPQSSVVELVQAGESGAGGLRIERLKGAPVVRLRDRLLPLVVLADLLKLDRPDRAAPLGDRYIVVTQIGPLALGLVVDRVFDTEEIVVKPVAPVVRHLTVFSGTTILGDGTVIMILDPAGIAAAIGEVPLEQAAQPNAAKAVAAQNERTASLLLFRAGSGGPKAVPLALVARLEEFDRSRFEVTEDRCVVQYRDRLTPLVGFDPAQAIGSTGLQPALVFADGDQVMALLVDEIIDIVEAALDIQLGSDQPGILGSAIIAGRATEVIDPSHFLMRANPGWFDQGLIDRKSRAAERRILVVDDSAFFREMLTPLLEAEGYRVTKAASGDEALGLRDSGSTFDAILSDIEMPGMTGLELAAEIRSGNGWRDTPLLAISGHAEALQRARALDSGFDDHIAKSDRTALLAKLSRALPPSRRAA